ncbi:hypothetical protein [Bradyrhizobium sp. Mp27]|uniref:hypothetical protein n=1 Tax=Bradyrhizobium sp. Mp27 TaxID=3042157 RepID=UPI00248C6696|nr:hypothetical protein [Bradyrhizobium sp. Mp27]MDI2077404.1 hypothetical protein [Bradyrhizobium sp. Mp27]
MFPYSDPTGTNALSAAGALQNYREKVGFFDRRFHNVAASGYTLREAFNELAPGTQAQTATVWWSAFPVTAPATERQIDNDRMRFQDEYVEWQAERQNGVLRRVTFTTEFSEYLQALAEAGVAPLKAEIANLVPGADPTDADLFGPGFNPQTASASARGGAFLAHLAKNPWNNGKRGILCLTQQFNTMSALFNLLGACGVPNLNVATGEVCGSVGGACGPGRNSDPAVCSAAQNLARGNSSFSLDDPAGIRISKLEPNAQWTLDGQAIDINDPATNQGIWVVSRNGRRGVFNLRDNLRVDGNRIQTGAQLSKLLIVGASVIHAPDAALPGWAQAGHEGSRGPEV